VPRLRNSAGAKSVSGNANVGTELFHSCVSAVLSLFSSFGAHFNVGDEGEKKANEIVLFSTS
jgi:hypothetical protein